MYPRLRVLLLHHSVVSDNVVQSNSSNSLGGAIWVGKGYLEILNSTLSHNRAVSVNANSFGGAIYVDLGVLNITSSQLPLNSADFGGAIAIYPSLPGKKIELLHQKE